MALNTAQTSLPPVMSEQEFDAWCDEDTRAELVDGEVIPMAPVSLLHYDTGDFLRALIRAYLKCFPHGRLLGPEVQVRLRPGLRRVPDLLFIAAAHQSRIKKNMVDGAPDAVWEIVSPESEARDWRDKYFEYEAAGVPEYWLIDPHSQVVHLYQRDPQGKYQRAAEEAECLASSAIPGFRFKPQWLWKEPLPDEVDCLREVGLAP